MTRSLKLPVLDRRAIVGLAIALYMAIVARSAWVCDDAFISLRVASNFASGYGLVHNVGERVQGYTNPLWVLLLGVAHAIWKDGFWVAMLSSLAVSLAAAVVLTAGVARRRMVGAAAVLALAFTQAFADFSTSGLENPLSHLLLAGFLAFYLAPSSRRSDRRVLSMWVLSGLLVLNRLDNLPVIAPAVVHLFSIRPWRRSLKVALVGLSPLIAWLLFSLVYYGSPVPNTAVAKLNADIPRPEMIGQGLLYLLHAVDSDPLAVCLLLLGCAVGWTRPRRAPKLVALGVVLQLGYVVWVSGDFMAGRFLTVPLLAAVCLLASPGARALERRAYPALAGLLAWVALVSPHRPFGSGPPLKEIPKSGIVSEREWYLDNMTLVANLRRRAYRAHSYWRDGERIRRGSDPVGVHTNVGLVGYAAGPTRYIVDIAALTDAFLARIPFEYRSDWRPGHLGRPVPRGYVESLKANKNLVEDPELYALYERVRLLTRGPLWSWTRLKTVAAFNVGLYRLAPRGPDGPLRQ